MLRDWIWFPMIYTREKVHDSIYIQWCIYHLNP
jgi:hypothetical protein